ncbi:hypothetical protein [Comamonas thiooxydans]|uniref:hypothetical protein n=1 Tax=Comamonas thiooxydans TaxID=363952 RepID=UPI001F52AAB2|nr:hypothetical protein [Comamonas thiooxydans]
MVISIVVTYANVWLTVPIASEQFIWGQPKIDMWQVAKALDPLELCEPVGLRLSLNAQLPFGQRRQCCTTILE